MCGSFYPPSSLSQVIYSNFCNFFRDRVHTSLGILTTRQPQAAVNCDQAALR